jgi:hypothetical protein
MAQAEFQIADSIPVNADTAKSAGGVFWKLMDLWGMNPKDQALLLGVKYHATKLKAWKREGRIPEDPDKLMRVGHLAGIHKNLRVLLPYNRRAVYDFMKTPQSFLLDGKVPIDLIRDGGEFNSYANIAAIRRRLDQLRV